MTCTERNEEICRLYQEGMSLRELFERGFPNTSNGRPVSRERIRQILKKAGIWKKPQTSHPTSERVAFLGVDLTTETKDALKVKAQEEGKSMSRMASDAIEDLVKP